MIQRFAILYGGPADGIRQAVDEFPRVIKFTVFEPLSVPNAGTPSAAYEVMPRTAEYRCNMRPVPLREVLMGYWERDFDISSVPDHEVALYTFVGISSNVPDRRRTR